jgi:hypothetical protein
MTNDEPIAAVDSSGLTDPDWAEINKLRRAHEDGGQDGLSEAMSKLEKDDPVGYIRVAGAFFPDMVREAIKDSMAEAGITEEDVREMVRKLESLARDQ